MSERMRRRSTVTVKHDLDSEWGFVSAILEDYEVFRTVYLWGPPGVGKTYTACRSGLGDREVYVITLTPETPAAELRGFWMPKGDGFVWQDGVFIKAMREGARVVINEISHASHDVLAILFPVLESAETASLTLPNLETVTPEEGFQVICTDNMEPAHLPEALKDRFNSIIAIENAHPEAVAKLDEKYRKAAARSSSLGDRSISMRAWLTLQQATAVYGEETAFRMVFGKVRGDQLRRSTILGS